MANWGSNEPDVLLELRKHVDGGPMKLSQWSAVHRALLWLKDHPQENYRSSVFIQSYLDEHYPWWKVLVNTFPIIRNGGRSFAFLSMGAIGQKFHSAIQDSAASLAGSLGLLWEVTQPPPPEPPRVPVSKAPNGKRVRKGRVRSPKPWAQFTVPPGRGRRRNFGR